MRKAVNKEGDLFKIFLIWYTFFRFWIEFLRVDKVIFIFNLSIAQIVAGSIFIVLLVYFLKSKKNIFNKKEALSGKEDL